MKIRKGFVSNSSSSSFIITTSEMFGEIRDLIKKLIEDDKELLDKFRFVKEDVKENYAHKYIASSFFWCPPPKKIPMAFGWYGGDNATFLLSTGIARGFYPKKFKEYKKLYNRVKKEDRFMHGIVAGQDSNLYCNYGDFVEQLLHKLDGKTINGCEIIMFHFRP